MCSLLLKNIIIVNINIRNLHTLHRYVDIFANACTFLCLKQYKNQCAPIHLYLVFLSLSLSSFFIVVCACVQACFFRYYKTCYVVCPMNAQIPAKWHPFFFGCLFDEEKMKWSSSQQHNNLQLIEIIQIISSESTEL